MSAILMVYRFLQVQSLIISFRLFVCVCVGVKWEEKQECASQWEASQWILIEIYSLHMICVSSKNVMQRSSVLYLRCVGGKTSPRPSLCQKWSRLWPKSESNNFHPLPPYITPSQQHWENYALKIFTSNPLLNMNPAVLQILSNSDVRDWGTVLWHESVSTQALYLWNQTA